LLIEHSDRRGVHLGHRGGDQALDALDLLGLQAPIVAHHQRHRRLGAHCAFAEHASLRQHDVHPGVLDFVERHDGARELALQGALVVDALRELGHAEIAVREDLEAHRALEVDALAHHLEARGVHCVVRHQNRGAIFADLVRHLHAVELGRDRGRVPRVEIGKQRLVVVPQDPDRGRHAESDHQYGRHDEAGLRRSGALVPHV
jgi:hypothetical protein